MADKADASRMQQLRRVAKRRGYTVSKVRRVDPLATDYGTWTIKGPGAPRGLVTLEQAEAFLNSPPREKR